MKDILYLINDFKNIEDKRARDVAFRTICNRFGFKEARWKLSESLKKLLMCSQNSGLNEELKSLYYISVLKCLSSKNSFISIKGFWTLFMRIFSREIIDVSRKNRTEKRRIDNTPLSMSRKDEELVGGEDFNILLFENRYDYETVTKKIKQNHKELLDEVIMGKTFDEIAVEQNTSRQNIQQKYSRIVNKLAEENWEK